MGFLLDEIGMRRERGIDKECSRGMQGGHEGWTRGHGERARKAQGMEKEYARDGKEETIKGWVRRSWGMDSMI